MNYGTLRTQFLDLLNRNDCDDDLADRFIGMGLRRLERLLRTPLQLTETTIQTASGWTGSFPIPNDYLGASYFKVGGEVIDRIATSQLEDAPGWYIEDGSFHFNFTIEEGTEIKLVYYNEFNFPVADGDTVTRYSSSIGDLIVYAAMVFACVHFVDTRLQSIKSELSEMVQETQAMADLDEWSGGGLAVTPYGGGIA